MDVLDGSPLLSEAYTGKAMHSKLTIKIPDSNVYLSK